MIPRDYITEWRAQAPWVQDIQVEQDLVISRALVTIFAHPILADALAFRGGTALYKLYVKSAARYSEDIDLVQMRAEPAGPVMDALRAVLDSWLGAPRWKQTDGRVTLTYRFASEDAPPLPMKLKVEINTREHFAVHGFVRAPFAVTSRWYEGTTAIPTYNLSELLGTKLRALYQRRKSRDLFDLSVALDHPEADPAAIVAAFGTYGHGGHAVTRAVFEKNLALKLGNRQFTADIAPLLAAVGRDWDMQTAAAKVGASLIARLPGPAWNGET